MPSTEPLPGKCGSPLRKKPGFFCIARPMANGSCRLHGGLSLKGIESPSFKHGRRSKYAFPGLLGKGYRQSLADPELLSMHHEVAALEGKIKEVGESMADEPPQWEDAVAAYREWRNAEPGKREQLEAKLDKILTSGLD